MLILGIESSCDDTSVALVKADNHGFKILAELTASQIDVHKKYGGVVPEIAGRKHAEKIMPLIEEVMSSGVPPTLRLWRTRRRAKPDVIAVTAGPGLITGLLVGVEAARTLAYLWNKPLVAVNHIEGHIHSVEIPNDKFPISNQIQNSKLQNKNKIQIPNSKFQIQYPALALIVSGGHTELIYIKKQGQYELVGKTRDDAAGECFDKVAKLLSLDYPGGPKISAHATKGNPKAIVFPRPMINDKNFDFSFSGLKTSALYWLRDNVSQSQILNLPPSLRLRRTSKSSILNNFCASFEQAIIDVLVTKTIRAAKKLNPQSIILAGGVSANQKLKTTLAEQIAILFPLSTFHFPLSPYSMDNAAMIAVAGYYQAKKKKFTSWQKITADPNWELTH